MLRGKIYKTEILTLKNDLSLTKKFGLIEDEKIKLKHILAEKNNRYVVKFKIVLDNNLDDRFYSVVQIFIPKAIIDNNLIENKTSIYCDDKTCHFKIAGIEDYFDKALLGATMIDDISSKKTKIEQ